MVHHLRPVLTANRPRRTRVVRAPAAALAHAITLPKVRDTSLRCANIDTVPLNVTRNGTLVAVALYGCCPYLESVAIRYV